MKYLLLNFSNSVAYMRLCFATQVLWSTVPLCSYCNWCTVICIWVIWRWWWWCLHETVTTSLAHSKRVVQAEDIFSICIKL